MTSRTAFIALIVYAGIISIVLLAVSIVCGLYHESVKRQTEHVNNLKKYNVGMMGEIDGNPMRQTAELNMEKNVMILGLYSEDNEMSAMAVIDQNRGLTTVYQDGMKMCFVIPGISKGMSNSTMANKYLEENETANMRVYKENTLNYTVSSTDNPMQDDSMIPASLMTSCSKKPMYWMSRDSASQTRKRRNISLGKDGLCLKRTCFRIFFFKVCVNGCVSVE